MVLSFWAKYATKYPSTPAMMAPPKVLSSDDDDDDDRPVDFLPPLLLGNKPAAVGGRRLAVLPLLRPMGIDL